MVMMAVIAFEGEAMAIVRVHKLARSAGRILPRCVSLQPRALRLWATGRAGAVVQVPAGIAPNDGVGPHRIAGISFPAFGLKHHWPWSGSLWRLSGDRSLSLRRRELSEGLARGFPAGFVCTARRKLAVLVYVHESTERRVQSARAKGGESQRRLLSDPLSRLE